MLIVMMILFIFLNKRLKGIKMKYLFKRLIQMIKHTRHQITLLIANRRIFKLMDNDVPIWKIAEDIRKNNIYINTNGLTSYIEMLEDLSFRDQTIHEIIFENLSNYIKLVYFTFLSLFSLKIVSIEDYEKVVNKISSIPTFNPSIDTIYGEMRIKCVLDPYVNKQDYEIAINYLNYLKSTNV